MSAFLAVISVSIGSRHVSSTKRHIIAAQLVYCASLASTSDLMAIGFICYHHHHMLNGSSSPVLTATPHFYESFT